MLWGPELCRSRASGETEPLKDLSCVWSAALEQLLEELDLFLKILDQENLSSTAVVKKSGLAELLRLYTKSSSECGPGRGEAPRDGKMACSSSQATIAKCRRQGGLHDTHLFSHALEARNPGPRSQQGRLLLIPLSLEGPVSIFSPWASTRPSLCMCLS